MLIIRHLQRGGGYVTPNICYVEENKGLKMKPYIPQTVNLITFNICGQTFQCEEGMTWEQWFDSKYFSPVYVDGWYLDGEESSFNMVIGNSNNITINDKIIANKTYNTSSQGGGSN